MTTRIIKLDTKWGDEFYPAADPEQLHDSALRILKQRVGEGFYYYNYDDGNPQNQWQDRAQKIVENDDGEEAWDFLEERSDHEYEGIYIDYMH